MFHVEGLSRTLSRKHMCVCYLSGAIGNLDHGGCGARCEDTSSSPRNVTRPRLTSQTLSGECSEAKVQRQMHMMRTFKVNVLEARLTS